MSLACVHRICALSWVHYIHMQQHYIHMQHMCAQDMCTHMGTLHMQQHYIHVQHVCTRMQTNHNNNKKGSFCFFFFSSQTKSTQAWIDESGLELPMVRPEFTIFSSTLTAHSAHRLPTLFASVVLRRRASCCSLTCLLPTSLFPLPKLLCRFSVQGVAYD